MATNRCFIIGGRSHPGKALDGVDLVAVYNAKTNMWDHPEYMGKPMKACSNHAMTVVHPEPPHRPARSGAQGPESDACIVIYGGLPWKV